MSDVSNSSADQPISLGPLIRLVGTIVVIAAFLALGYFLIGKRNSAGAPGDPRAITHRVSGPPGVPTLRRVMLSTGGVGYFEYEADVVGNAQLSLPVRMDQVDDV